MRDIALRTSIQRAQAFLLERRAPDGLWRDFLTLAGTSDEWVSAFVAHALAESDVAQGDLLPSSKALLYRQRWNGGWSYNRRVPPDCDSTAWALIASGMAPIWKPSSMAHAVAYVKQHQILPDGGFATYAAEDGIDRYIGAAEQNIVQGWLTTHTCVTGVALQALLLHGEPRSSDTVRSAIAYLLREQDPNGTWRSYWWTGFGYATYHALKAISMARRLGDQVVSGARGFFLRHQRQDGGWSDVLHGDSRVFETAFTLLALLLIPSREILKRADASVSWLRANQSEDGGWESAPMLRIPAPMVTSAESVTVWRINEPGTGVMLDDGARLFTSAAALWALARYASISA
jgi:squalene cyclase